MEVDYQTQRKIESLDIPVILKYLQRRQNEGMFFLAHRWLGGLGTRRLTDTKDNYNRDTSYMVEVLQKKISEDQATYEAINKMDIPTLEDYIKKRMHHTIFKSFFLDRAEGKLLTRTRLTNTVYNYKQDNAYLRERLKFLKTKVPSIKRSSSKTASLKATSAKATTAKQSSVKTASAKAASVKRSSAKSLKATARV
jgi:hypothetical protein